MSKKRKKYPAAVIANHFLRLAKREGELLTPMKLIKLVYFAHGYSLAITGNPLLEEKVEAWKYGPVIDSLYEEVKKYGRGSVSALLPTGQESIEDLQVKALIEIVWNGYGHLSARKLSDLTHMPGTPWYQTASKYALEIPRHEVIDNTLILSYFKTLVNSIADA